MCGIVGFISTNNTKKNIKDILLHGLRELEYRGYDSAGIAVIEASNPKNINIYKEVGKLKNLELKCKDYSPSINAIGIGHTRWATHGKVTVANAHPHISDIATIVHNGIIENYKELKDELLQKGHIFLSETDSEVIVKLFSENLKNEKDPLVAFKTTIARLVGAYAILLISNVASGTIFYAKNGSPLIIGQGIDGNGAIDGVYFASSDAPLIGYASEIVYLEDGDLGSIDSSGISHLKGLKKLNANITYAQKDGFRYFMEKEIYEQSEMLAMAISGRIYGEQVVFDELQKGFLDGIDELVICACGTSFHAGMVGKYLIERIGKLRVSVMIASEFRYADFVINKKALFVTISQSGETADTLEALKLAKNKGLKSLAICNVDNSSIVRLSDATLLTRAGIEKGVASTKAFSSQVMILWLFGLFIAQNTKSSTTSVDFPAEIASIYASIKATKEALKLHDRIKRLSKRYLHGHGFFYIGRDVFYPLALEAALKLKEISYLHAEGYPSGEMKHGPIALVDEELYTIAFVPKYRLFDKVLSNVAELGAREATICVMSQEDLEIADDLIKIPKLASYMEEFYAMNVASQLFALEIGIKLGNDVDMPRNLAKSVTVE